MATEIWVVHEVQRRAVDAYKLRIVRMKRTREQAYRTPSNDMFDVLMIIILFLSGPLFELVNFNFKGFLNSLLFVTVPRVHNS